MTDSASPSGLFDRPVLVIDPGFHTAPIIRADVDAASEIAVSGSHDGTVRVWSLTDGALRQTIRLPRGPSNVGKVYSVAISPDGELVAAGGWTRWTETDQQQQIYIFSAINGIMRQRIEGLPNVVLDLAFSPAGDRLVAALGAGGIRHYARDDVDRWTEVATDSDYGNQSYGVAFAANSRLATTCCDGRLRLYDAGGNLLRSVATPHARPIGLAFNPAVGRLAVGFDDATEVLFFDGETLAPLPSPDVGGIGNGILFTVAWSADGTTLFAAGRYKDGGVPVAAWGGGGTGPRLMKPAGDNAVMSLRPLPDGALLVAAGDPWLGVIEVDGAPRWTRRPRQLDPGGQRTNLAVSHDGMLVEFGPRVWGKEDRLRFDVAALQLLPPAQDDRVAPPVHESIAVADWVRNTAPSLDGAPLPLDPYEIARSLVNHPDGERFLLGTDFWLRAFDRTSTALWQHRVPGSAWAVNISGDGRLAVAAYADGTLRWHRMEDGAELLALFPLPDGDGIATRSGSTWRQPTWTRRLGLAREV